MKILIATDGSEFSEAAVETVCQMFANSEDAAVKIVSAYEQPLMAVAAAPYAIPAGYNPVYEKEMQQLATQSVEAAGRKISERFPDSKLNVTTCVLCGPPERAIIDEAENWGADLIVVGSHGYGFWSRTLLGSVSNSVVHHAPCSVLIVRPKNNAKS